MNKQLFYRPVDINSSLFMSKSVITKTKKIGSQINIGLILRYETTFCL
jgi:hypothetical protein